MDIKKKRRVHFSELEADVSEDRGEQKDKETAMKSCIFEVWQNSFITALAYQSRTKLMKYGSR